MNSRTDGRHGSAATLADVRNFLKHVPEERRQFGTWKHVEAELEKAAAGADTTQLSIALQLVLMLEGVEVTVPVEPYC